MLAMSRGVVLGSCALVALLAVALASSGVRSSLYARMRPRRSVEQVVERLGPEAETRLRPKFERVGVGYPPRRVALVGLKAERRLELWAQGEEGWRFVGEWEVLAASGGPGPKLREGDRQVPEGV